ncbi:glyoxalase/bleomycin resistance/dioxygenase family protein [Pseudomonas cavernicola]|uniref:Glyoxalase/bleomycin resistance/dioxygenase family protein n=1 Tax=Pseudomonas cavernicola TaxID=2320866 RepID=A0A418XBM2_9PSED|nr:VOC family protein [Pseudomonas cavernicola]RJG09748.1 glyoxalase/bleomycin resistance/dioxygenase family protein [Pseudomonas cavernicola]
MKRLHIHIGVADLDQAVAFYSGLFASEPSVRHDDYAKWMLEDPRVNFAISTRSGQVGLDHLGIQAEDAEELAELENRAKAAGTPVAAESGACCYMESDKYWTVDPAGIAWEQFHSLNAIPTFNRIEAKAKDSACCAPKVEKPRVVIKNRELSCKPGSGCC